MSITRPPDRQLILLEDEHIIAIDKPAGLLVHADADAGSVLAMMREREAERGGDPEQLHLVHRLDRDTSGVLLLARSAEVAKVLGQAFRERRVHKLYLALTHPVPAVRWAKVEHQLAAKRIQGGEKMIVVEKNGVAAVSEVEVLARGRRFGLVRVIPEQGRKHQVRVALSELGAPIAGDFLYGGTRQARMASRMMLHARGLDLAHPVEAGRHLSLRAPLPADFRELYAEDGGLVPSDLDRRHRGSPAPERTRKRR